MKWFDPFLGLIHAVLIAALTLLCLYASRIRQLKTPMVLLLIFSVLCLSGIGQTDWISWVAPPYSVVIGELLRDSLKPLQQFLLLLARVAYASGILSLLLIALQFKKNHAKKPNS